MNEMVSMDHGRTFESKMKGKQGRAIDIISQNGDNLKFVLPRMESIFSCLAMVGGVEEKTTINTRTTFFSFHYHQQLKPPSNTNLHSTHTTKSTNKTITTMSFFKSSKNQTSSAAPSASATPVQSPRSSMQASRPKDQPKMTVDQVLEMAMKKSGATFHQLPLILPFFSLMETTTGDSLEQQRLPNECLLHIVSYLHDDLKALKALLTVNRVFFHAIVPDLIAKGSQGKGLASKEGYLLLLIACIIHYPEYDSVPATDVSIKIMFKDTAGHV
ncbi:MAG: hypothetical protein BYD32DRAFT_491996 [Podila humilis]|nr:MAG: hypothetical protein BYD32DRAFT_491996 [Podila humilis]